MGIMSSSLRVGAHLSMLAAVRDVCKLVVKELTGWDAREFSISLLQTLVIEEPGVKLELHNLLDALAKVAMRSGSPDSVQQLIAVVRYPSTVRFDKEDKGQRSRDKKEDYNYAESVKPDPAGFREQVSMLFVEVCRICEPPGENNAACTHYFLQLQQNGPLKGDDMSEHFFRILTGGWAELQQTAFDESFA